MGTAALEGRRFRFDGSGFFSVLLSGFERIQANREAKAEAFVRPYLARLSEEELRASGFAPSEIAKIKTSKKSDLPYLL